MRCQKGQSENHSTAVSAKRFNNPSVTYWPSEEEAAAGWASYSARHK